MRRFSAVVPGGSNLTTTLSSISFPPQASPQISTGAGPHNCDMLSVLSVIAAISHEAFLDSRWKTAETPRKRVENAPGSAFCNFILSTFLYDVYAGFFS